MGYGTWHWLRVTEHHSKKNLQFTSQIDFQTWLPSRDKLKTLRLILLVQSNLNYFFSFIFLQVFGGLIKRF